MLRKCPTCILCFLVQPLFLMFFLLWVKKTHSLFQTEQSNFINKMKTENGMWWFIILPLLVYGLTTYNVYSDIPLIPNIMLIVFPLIYWYLKVDIVSGLFNILFVFAFWSLSLTFYVFKNTLTQLVSHLLRGEGLGWYDAEKTWRPQM